MNRYRVVVFLHIALGWRIIHSDDNEKCVAAFIPDLNKCRRSGIYKVNSSKCVRNSICNKTFGVSVIQMEPISSELIPGLLNHLLSVCCGTCGNTYVKNTFTDPERVNILSISSSHFVYPILGVSNINSYFGFYYIPLIEAPDMFLVSRITSPKDVLFRLVSSCTNLWPILIICLLMAFIAGFPVWLSETWFNEKEFPRSFFVGMFEGFWWSFISMTTVGYGDKAPKFIVARCVAVLWILTGITIVSTFTAALTTEISTATAVPTPTMAGIKIGILNGRIYDASVVLKKGGYVDMAENGSVMESIFELIEKLRNKNISGILIDKHAYTKAHGYFTNNTENTTIAKFFKHQTYHTVIDRGGVVYSYGILVKEKEDYDYFNQFVVDNHLNLQICKELQMHQLPDEGPSKMHDIFSPDAGLFKISIKITLTLLAVIICIGVLYEIARKKICKNFPRNNSVE